MPKIREVDGLLSDDDTAKLRIREIHPELCFWALAGHPMHYSKKQREGLSERIQVLSSIYPHTPDIIGHTLSIYKRKEVARDDILDALSAAVTAIMGEQNLVSIPQISEWDARGLRMEMVCCP
jgi:predicted RNase H-like nuclease